MSFENADFKNAQLPALTPLVNSFSVDDVEDELKRLFIDLFHYSDPPDAPVTIIKKSFAESLFDANVLGAAHLGTFDLVKRSINADGLSLLPNNQEGPNTRYLYRAWRARNMQGRGLFFLKTYLRLLYGPSVTVEQQMQHTKYTYPNRLSDRKTTGDHANKYLTSRIHITLNVNDSSGDLSVIIPIISSIVPARIVPRFYLSATSAGGVFYDAIGNLSQTFRFDGHIT